MVTGEPWLLKYLQIGPMFNLNLQPVLLQGSNFHLKYFVEVILCDIPGQGFSSVWPHPHCEEVVSFTNWDFSSLHWWPLPAFCSSAVHLWDESGLVFSIITSLSAIRSPVPLILLSLKRNKSYFCLVHCVLRFPGHLTLVSLSDLLHLPSCQRGGTKRRTFYFW